jgi:hypothetical protein
MPGVWEITSGEFVRQIDTKKTKGKDKAVLIDLGLMPPRMQARGKLCSPEDWEMLQDAMPDIHPRKAGGLKFPLAIFHPAVALLGINQIYIERIRTPEIREGILEIQIDMIEWTDQPKVSKTKKVEPKTDADVAIMVAQLRGAGQFHTSTLQAANISYTPPEYTVDDDFAALSGQSRNAPEFTVSKSIDPTK